MNYIQLVNDAIDYIEKNLNQNISVEDISNRFFISKYYFVRIFKALTNYTVKEYIEKRRMTEAAKKLIKSQRKVIDIAFEFGYGSHEVFTRKFKKFFSLTPREAKERSLNISGYERIKIVERDFVNLKSDLIVNFELIHKNEFKIYGKNMWFNSNNSFSIYKLTPFVEEFVSEYIDNSNISRMYNAVTSEKGVEEYGYFVGYHQQESIKSKEQLELTIPESDYAVFKYKADLAQIHKTVMNDICRTIMISEFILNKIGIEFFLVFEEDFLETNEYDIYVPVKT